MRLFKPPEIDPVPEDLPGIQAYILETLDMTNELWDMIGAPWKWLAWRRLHAQIKARNAASERALQKIEATLAPRMNAQFN